ncbi:MAG: hypothetical protein A3J30_00510 [Candidatus Wildermuthbacteria bacterium RIFCSPLOWO2_02_FULL_47_9c]|uniref:Uncharacterized protein n=2 Tax=Parcubacteria group TaxID=1794811 RepID=A0A837IKJ6_9BACT|nr:MAG: hypothetical protein UY25_C0004G0023 [Candidatus Yanofskybacteria bacterium GW2011_GWC1_48_11]KKW04541.1 MAG: hypothetical protein UY38_C0001G0108 [Parcubacteria group bacterium GW2011_GWB1_49_12]KKW09201.1 MAG: hypothetical protein UY45_C0001G0087 [Parcubacteria group bacterium GW2011_GWA1_49_26]KKW14162.1 MAG: hypothetical protein UY53_C0003G0082 [Parcubacteria group bacterium GW2011_GWA2_50_10]OHA61452.1 MAG: hypothetical protein A2109_01060 [Candidatus Wildermuthbacteria bacterium G
MKKKIALAGIAVFAALGSVAGLSAFEAYVINVTAQIENALFVHPEARDFGTMFPQEYKELGFFVTFSESFSTRDQDRVSKIDYQIKQKPKCADSVTNPTEFSKVTEDENGEFICQNPGHVMLPLLCPYLSKTPANLDGNDVGIPAFHDPAAIATGTINKQAAHVGDNWTIDLAVPCFEGQCAQDWSLFVESHNPDADPDEFMANPEDESKVFGCDLWVEVTRIY